MSTGTTKTDRTTGRDADAARLDALVDMVNSDNHRGRRRVAVERTADGDAWLLRAEPDGLVLCSRRDARAMADVLEGVAYAFSELSAGEND